MVCHAKILKFIHSSPKTKFLHFKTATFRVKITIQLKYQYQRVFNRCHYFLPTYFNINNSKGQLKTDNI